MPAYLWEGASRLRQQHIHIECILLELAATKLDTIPSFAISFGSAVDTTIDTSAKTTLLCICSGNDSSKRIHYYVYASATPTYNHTTAAVMTRAAKGASPYFSLGLPLGKFPDCFQATPKNPSNSTLCTVQTINNSKAYK